MGVAAILLIAVIAGACGESDILGPTDRPASAAPTGLKTEPPTVAPQTTAVASPKPTGKPKGTPKPTKKPASYYKPPGWDGHSDVDCSDFDTHAHAQSFFKGTGGSKTNDPYRLDGNHDGIACESLP